MLYHSATPLLIVDEIEPCLFFWAGRLGFTKVAEVFEGNRLGFVMLVKDQVQIMYQSVASLKKDLPDVHQWLDAKKNTSVVYCKVSSIEWIEKHLDGVDVVVPRRVTDYGATEIGIKEPSGNIILFACFPDSKAGESNL